MRWIISHFKRERFSLVFSLVCLMIALHMVHIGDTINRPAAKPMINISVIKSRDICLYILTQWLWYLKDPILCLVVAIIQSKGRDTCSELCIHFRCFSLADRDVPTTLFLYFSAEGNIRCTIPSQSTRIKNDINKIKIADSKLPALY